MKDASSPPPMFVPMRMRSRGPVATVPARISLQTDVEQPAAPVIVAAPIGRSNDIDLIAILDAPLTAGETTAAGFARKERELMAAMATRTVLAAYALHKRLANPQRDDVLADKLSRLTVDRRHRLVQFLADARRRAALAGGK